MLDIPQLLSELAQQRPIFHSEADFQHALAWHLHTLFPEAKIRLEYPFYVEKWIYVDIWAEIAGLTLAIELKYKTAAFQTTFNGELFHLKNQGAQDTGRYDFIKDVQRLEQVVSRRPNTTGYVVMLTNDSLYWSPTIRETTDSFFRIHDGKILSGSMVWSERASPGTMYGRSEPLKLTYVYSVKWDNYSKLDGAKGNFNYLSLKISP